MTCQGAIDVDMPKYAAGYAALTWNTRSAPDPIDTVSGDGPAAPPPVAASAPVPAPALAAAAGTRAPKAIMSAAGLPVVLGHYDGAACRAGHQQTGSNAQSCQAPVLQSAE